MGLPSVSVVMGVKNASVNLGSTIAALLSQQGVDLEVIVVNDGSTDSTGDVLDKLLKEDSRLQVISRPQRGLTVSLAEGCKIARGEFIARQDAGDWSVPDRLRKQAECLVNHPDASLCSSHVRFIVPEGPTLEIRRIKPEDLAKGLCGPAHHGSVMMRKDLYLQSGGYRDAFYYAQDIDLWSRLVELGSHQVLPDILYIASVTPGSISGSRRKEQDSFHQIIEAMTAARRSNQSEEPWLRKAESLSRLCKASVRNRKHIADGTYFIGSCLAAIEPTLANQYLTRTLELNPWHLRARMKLMRGK